MWQWNCVLCRQHMFQILVREIWRLVQKLSRVSVNLVQVFFWHKFLAHNWAQLYSSRETVRPACDTNRATWLAGQLLLCKKLWCFLYKYLERVSPALQPSTELARSVSQSMNVPLRGLFWMLMACVWYWPSSFCRHTRCESASVLKLPPNATTWSSLLFNTLISCGRHTQTRIPLQA